MRMFSTRAMVAFISTLVFCLLQAAYAVQIDQIVVFGDSLSDNGNIFSLTSKAHKVFSSVPVIPKNPPYYQGRFSNGPIWVDDLAAAMNVPLVDYAYGGAWAEPLHDSRLVVPFGLGLQVSYYLVMSVADFYKANHLYIIWAGGNDYVSGRDDVDYATTNTVNSIESQIDWLVYYGAKNIIIMNLPDLSLVPEVSSKGRDAIENVKQLVSAHNLKLSQMVTNQQTKHPELKIIFGDVTVAFNETYYNHDKYNIKNVTTPCYTGGYTLRAMLSDRQATREFSAAKEQNIDIANTPSLRVAYATARLADNGVEACDAPDEFMFWDQIHPTRVTHNLMALDAMTILNKHDIQGVPLEA